MLFIGMSFSALDVSTNLLLSIVNSLRDNISPTGPVRTACSSETIKYKNSFCIYRRNAAVLCPSDYINSTALRADCQSIRPKESRKGRDLFIVVDGKLWLQISRLHKPDCLRSAFVINEVMMR